MRRHNVIYGDHITVKNTSEEVIEGSRALIDAEITAGCNSFAVDADRPTARV